MDMQTHLPSETNITFFTLIDLLSSVSASMADKVGPSKKNTVTVIALEFSIDSMLQLEMVVEAFLANEDLLADFTFVLIIFVPFFVK
jgi:hypothetical protein